MCWSVIASFGWVGYNSVGRVLGTEASVFLLISVALAVFNLSKTLKDDVQSDEQLPGLVKFVCPSLILTFRNEAFLL